MYHVKAIFGATVRKLLTWNTFPRKTMCFQWWIKQSLAPDANREECISSCLSFPVSPPLVSWARETAVFSRGREERMNAKLWYLAGCQNNGKPHTCRLLASRAGEVTNGAFLALLTSTPLATFLSLSVHKGLDFSPEAWGCIKQFYYCF